ncbi:MAG: 50S ribosomal protein L25 [Bacteroidota bacterium]|nr:50S ribosomal protein L25 [Candidatus Kapabacteria bacterium]MDW8221208.1 50S ribosomal protein L25 [Bacteroidota bacterium]
MSAITLEAQRRAVGKKASKAVRKAGLIPGIFYAKGKEPIPIATTLKQIRPAVYTSDTHIITMKLDSGETLDCVLKDVAFDPVTDEIVHFDLLGIVEGQTLHVEVPIVLKGTAKGVSIGGGILEHLMHKVQIECLPSALPEHIEIDISDLEIGKSIHVGDVKVPGVKFLAHPSASIVAIHAKRGREESSATPPAKG